MNTQFDLGAMLSAPQQIAVQQIPCEQLHPYHNHKFELYTGERLDDMIESIRENGVLSPIIVQPDGNGYEIPDSAKLNPPGTVQNSVDMLK
jgi:ParB family chromosome partitioning protein